MRRLFLVAVLFAALAAAPAVVEAQIHGTPASVTSSTPRRSSGGVPASVTSLGPSGFGDFRGRDFGHHGFGRRDFGRHSGFGVSVGFGRNPRVRIHFGSRRHFHHRRPVFVPVYVPYYYPYYPVAYAQPVPAAEPAYYDDTYGSYDDPPALTVFERRSQYIRRDQYQDSRYGEHYFDPRDEARRELEERDARVRQRREAQDEQYAPPPREENAALEPEEDVPTTVLIFRDGTRREVKNYAIVGDTLWELSASRARKVPLADLNLQATIRENEERGVDFRLPKSAATSSAPRLPNLLGERR